MGKGPIEQSNVDMMWAHCQKLKEVSTYPCYGGDLNEEGILAECKPSLDTIAAWMSDKDWMAGKNITWIDFMFWENLEMLDFLAKGHFDEFYPFFAGYRKRFVTNPEFAKIWASDDKCMKSPFNGDQARFGARENSLVQEEQ